MARVVGEHCAEDRDRAGLVHSFQPPRSPCPGWRPDYSHVSGNPRGQAFSLSNDRLEKHTITRISTRHGLEGSGCPSMAVLTTPKTWTPWRGGAADPAQAASRPPSWVALGRLRFRGSRRLTANLDSEDHSTSGLRISVDLHLHLGECLAVSSQLVSEPSLGFEPHNCGLEDPRVSVYRAGQIYADDIGPSQIDAELGRQRRHSDHGCLVDERPDPLACIRRVLRQAPQQFGEDI